MSKRQSGKVLKEFSALKQQKRIDIAAFALYQLVFKGERERAFEPRAGTELHRVWKMGRLNLRQQRAWMKFRDDCDKAHGKSGGVTSSYGEQTGGNEPTEKRLTAYENEEYRRVMHLVHSYLIFEERQLLQAMLQNDLKTGEHLSLELVGLIRSGYSDEGDARASGVTHIQTLLTRVASYYNF